MELKNFRDCIVDKVPSTMPYPYLFLVLAGTFGWQESTVLFVRFPMILGFLNYFLRL